MNDLNPLPQNLDAYDEQTQAKIRELIDADAVKRRELLQSFREPDATVLGTPGVGSMLFRGMSPPSGPA